MVVATIGVSDLVIVASKKGILVCSKRQGTGCAGDCKKHETKQ